MGEVGGSKSYSCQKESQESLSLAGQMGTWLPAALLLSDAAALPGLEPLPPRPLPLPPGGGSSGGCGLAMLASTCRCLHAISPVRARSAFSKDASRLHASMLPCRLRE